MTEEQVHIWTGLIISIYGSSWGDQVQDIVQETLTRVQKALNNGQTILSAYVVLTARSIVVDMVRANARYGYVEEVPETFRSCDNVESEAAAHQMLYEIERLCTPAQWEILFLRKLQGYTTIETALIVGRSEDAVKKLLARAILNAERLRWQHPRLPRQQSTSSHSECPNRLRTVRPTGAIPPGWQKMLDRSATG